MTSFIENANAGAIALRDVGRKYDNIPREASSPFQLSKTAPFRGFVDVEIGDCPIFTMFSNNDDYVAQNYFWNGADAYEPMSLKLWLALARNSAVIFDIGAYTGVYSLAAASRNRKSKIYAFEALDTVYSRLIINKTANSFGNIDLVHAAVTDREGLVEFNVYSGDGVLSTGSSIMEKQTGRSVFKKKAVKAVKLDDLVGELNLKQLELMKIDAEGAEHLIFQGGLETLNRFSPDIVCEFLKDAQTTEIARMLSSLGFRYFRIDEQKLSVEPVVGISVGDNMDSLNTLITRKTPEQIQKIVIGIQ